MQFPDNPNEEESFSKDCSPKVVEIGFDFFQNKIKRLYFQMVFFRFFH